MARRSRVVQQDGYERNGEADQAADHAGKDDPPNPAKRNAVKPFCAVQPVTHKDSSH